MVDDIGQFCERRVTVALKWQVLYHNGRSQEHDCEWLVRDFIVARRQFLRKGSLVVPGSIRGYDATTHSGMARK